MGTPPDRLLVLIDAECALCNRMAQFLIRRDPGERIQFAALSSAAALNELSRRGLPPPPPGTFVLVENGRAYFRSDAALRLAVHLGRPWSLLAVLRLVPRPLRDAIYSTVARLRLRLFGRIESCALLDPHEKSRFL